MANKSVSRATMLNVTIIVEALMLLVAAIWIQMAGLQISHAFAFSYKPVLIGIATGVVMAFAGLGAFRLGKNVAVFSQVRELVESYLMPMVAELKLVDLIIISIISGFCEEVFFRGVVQPQFGLPLTAIAFGLFHDPSFRHIAYSLTALLYGIVLGLLYQYTGNIWAPIFAHMTHNMISLYVVRFRLKPPAAPVSAP